MFDELRVWWTGHGRQHGREGDLEWEFRRPCGAEARTKSCNL